MAGFRKAQPAQAFDKCGMYGASGCGKTFTALLCAEGYAAVTEKRIAVVDTEHGTDFYAMLVPERRVHPDAFDFDAIYTRSISDILREIRALDPKKYGVLVLDQMTHVWEACMQAYSGKTTSAGTIPFHAWGKIKKPYKDLMTAVLNLPIHVFLLGREKNEYTEDEDTGELKVLGKTMRAEGETPYEPHRLIRMQQIREKKAPCVIAALIEKDRTGLLAGKMIHWPTFDTLCKPLLPLLGLEQAQIETADETATKDAEAMAEGDEAKRAKSEDLYRKFHASFLAADNADELDKAAKAITPEIKKQMLTEHVSKLKEEYLRGQTLLSRGAVSVTE